MTSIASIFCRGCNKDITTSKRTKSPQGHYFCEACVAAAKKKKAAAAAAASPSPAPFPAPSKSSPAPAPAPSSEFDLAPLPELAPLPDLAPIPFGDEPTPNIPAAPRPSATVPSASQKLPSHCPNCGTPVLRDRRICFKCQRDVTTMDKLIAIKAKQSTVSKEEKFGNLVGRIFKIAFILAIIFVLAFSSYGVWMMFHQPGPFDEYPLTRDKAVHQFLADISEGTDKSYNDAYMLISTRVRFGSNVKEQGYQAAYTQMHNDFVTKYGADWLTKAKIESTDPDSTDDGVNYHLTLNDDVYHIYTQVQISSTSGVEQILTHEKYPEDGKHHFGIADVEEYTLLPKSKEQVEAEREKLRAKNHPNPNNLPVLPVFPLGQ